MSRTGALLTGRKVRSASKGSIGVKCGQLCLFFAVLVGSYVLSLPDASLEVGDGSPLYSDNHPYNPFWHSQFKPEQESWVSGML